MPKRHNGTAELFCPRETALPPACPQFANWTRPLLRAPSFFPSFWQHLLPPSPLPYLLLPSPWVGDGGGGGFPPVETKMRGEDARTPVLFIIVLGRAEKGLIMLCSPSGGGGGGDRAFMSHLFRLPAWATRRLRSRRRCLSARRSVNGLLGVHTIRVSVFPAFLPAVRLSLSPPLPSCVLPDARADRLDVVTRYAP